MVSSVHQHPGGCCTTCAAGAQADQVFVGLGGGGGEKGCWLRGTGLPVEVGCGVRPLAVASALPSSLLWPPLPHPPYCGLRSPILPIVVSVLLSSLLWSPLSYPPYGGPCPFSYPPYGGPCPLVCPQGEDVPLQPPTTQYPQGLPAYTGCTKAAPGTPISFDSVLAK